MTTRLPRLPLALAALALGAALLFVLDERPTTSTPSLAPDAPGSSR